MSVPALRFKEFSGDWEIKNLGDLFDIVVGFVGTVSDSYCSEGDGIPFIRTLNVKNGWFSHDNIQYVSKQFHAKNKKSQIYNDDVLIARVGANMGMVCKVNGLKKEANSANVIIIKKDLKHNSDFYSLYLSSSKGQKQIQAKGAGGAQEVLNISVTKTLVVPIPSLPEQTKIANFLTAVDEKISILTQKATLLSQYKKGVMQQIFSQELRFKDDDGQEFPEWEEKSLGDVTKKISDNRNKELTDAKVYSVTNNNGFVLQSEHFDRVIAGSDLTNYKIIQKHEFAYNPSRINVGSIALFDNDIGIISSLYVCFSTTDKLLDRFLLNVLELEYTKFQIENLGEGGVRVYLWYDLFSLIKFKIPSLPEQTKIANFLTAVDEKITTNQNQLDAVKQYKQGLLQQMFV
jgi:type I restriction enzyme S subunit